MNALDLDGLRDLVNRKHDVRLYWGDEMRLRGLLDALDETRAERDYWRRRAKAHAHFPNTRLGLAERTAYRTADLRNAR